jgi:hypothetical protein
VVSTFTFPVPVVQHSVPVVAALDVDKPGNKTACVEVLNSALTAPADVAITKLSDVPPTTTLRVPILATTEEFLLKSKKGP